MSLSRLYSLFRLFTLVSALWMLINAHTSNGAAYSTDQSAAYNHFKGIPIDDTQSVKDFLADKEARGKDDGGNTKQRSKSSADVSNVTVLEKSFDELDVISDKHLNASKVLDKNPVNAAVKVAKREEEEEQVGAGVGPLEEEEKEEEESRYSDSGEGPLDNDHEEEVEFGSGEGLLDDDHEEEVEFGSGEGPLDDDHEEEVEFGSGEGLLDDDHEEEVEFGSGEGPLDDEERSNC
ncbi:hypothetical protein EGW08_023203 [Elysia chlorotica]|uniref:Uncharacterized protein n=1 Tax=Elysia chlorotica TaxID=188477 RepID=A0A433SJ09_ELYCH|nr:hypothetical protein EGW08_023203 [Elysia chlorotica]